MRRYRGIRIIGKCEHCGMPLPFPGPVRQILCSHCLETNQRDAGFWGRLIDAADCGETLSRAFEDHEVDVSEKAPPAQMQGEARAVPQWLGPLVPSARRIFGARLEEDAEGAAAEVPEASQPVVMSCPNCSGSLKITGETERTTQCEYCQTDIYLPDDLWHRLHPVAKATRWFVEYEGEGSLDRQVRLTRQLEQKAKEIPGRELKIELDALYAQRNELRKKRQSWGSLVVIGLACLAAGFLGPLMADVSVVLGFLGALPFTALVTLILVIKRVKIQRRLDEIGRSVDDIKGQIRQVSVAGSGRVTSLAGVAIEPEATGLIPGHVARELRCIPLRRGEDGSLLVALADPSTLRSVDNLRYTTGCDIKVVVVGEDDVDAAIRSHYGQQHG